MNHYQWSQRLRGHINLKTCLGLGAVALAGAFVIHSPAQNTKQNVKAPKGCLTCGAGSNSGGSGVTNTPTKDVEQARLDNAKRQTAKSLVPKGVTLTGTITGPFARTNSVQFEQQTIKFSEADQYLYNAKAIYNIAVELKSQRRNVFGVALRPSPSPSSTDKNDTETPLSVTTDVGVQNLGLQGAATGSFLAHNGVSWVVATQAPSTTPTYSGETVVKDGAQIRGKITGLFVNFANDKLEHLTHDITDTTGLGPTGFGYQADVEVKHSTPVLQGAGLKDANGKVSLLTVVTDTPVKMFHLRGILNGALFGSSGIGWSAITTDDVKRAGLLGQSSTQKPRFVSLAYTADTESSLPRSLLFVPDEHNSLITPVGDFINLLKKLEEVIFGRITDKFKGEYAVSSTSSGSDTATPQTQESESGPHCACPSSVNATIPASPGSGYVVDATTDNAQAGISVLDDWKKDFSPESPIQEVSDVHIVEKGRKDVKVLWRRYHTTVNRSVIIRFARVGTTAPFTKIVHYSVVVTQWSSPKYVQELSGTSCPDTSCPTPAPTPTPDPEDLNHNGIPDYKESTTNGTATPVAPPTAPQP